MVLKSAVKWLNPNKLKDRKWALLVAETINQLHFCACVLGQRRLERHRLASAGRLHASPQIPQQPCKSQQPVSSLHCPASGLVDLMSIRLSGPELPVLPLHLVPIEPVSQPIKVPVNYSKAGTSHAGNRPITLNPESSSSWQARG